MQNNLQPDRTFTERGWTVREWHLIGWTDTAAPVSIRDYSGYDTTQYVVMWHGREFAVSAEVFAALLDVAGELRGKS